MADEEQTAASPQLDATIAATEPEEPSAATRSPPATTEPEAEVEAEEAVDTQAAPAGAAEGDIDAIPPSDTDTLTTVVRGENPDAGARTAAIFDEDDEDDQDGLPSFRKREMRDANDPDAAIVRKKKKKRHLSPDAPVSRGSAEEVHDEPEEEEDPYANMTETESKLPPHRRSSLSSPRQGH